MYIITTVTLVVKSDQESPREYANYDLMVNQFKNLIEGMLNACTHVVLKE
jgi:hypothetical protein